MMADENAPAAKKQASGWLNVIVDYGPLVAFLAVYKYYSPAEPEIAAEIGAIIRGTLTFMVAAIAALAFSKWRFGKVSPMLWLSTALIVGFGSLTIYFRDPDLIQIKPTVIYVGFGIALIVGWTRRKALLKILLEAAFEGLDDAGWLKLSRNWGIFFLMLAALNEGLRYFYNLENGNFDTWLWAKIWVFMPLTFLFTFSQIPMLLKHGLGIEGLKEEETTPPPTA